MDAIQYSGQWLIAQQITETPNIDGLNPIGSADTRISGEPYVLNSQPEYLRFTRNTRSEFFSLPVT